MTQPAKFTFDLDLAQSASTSKLIEQRDIDLLISQAKAQGYAEGLAAGQTSIESQTNQQIAAAAEQVAAHGQQFLTKLDSAQAHHLTTATTLAASVGKKLATHLIEKFPLDEIDALLKDCLSSLGKTAHLVVRCNDQLSDRVKPIAEQYAQQAGYEGRLIIMGEPDIAPGDCRIEWSDGGLARHLNNLIEEIDQKLAQYVQRKGPTQQPVELPAEHDATSPDAEQLIGQQSPEEIQ